MNFRVVSKETGYVRCTCETLDQARNMVSYYNNRYGEKCIVQTGVETLVPEHYETVWVEVK